MQKKQYPVTRRQFIQSLAAVSAGALTAPAATRKQYQAPQRVAQYVRKSASVLADAEIARFKRGFDLIIKNGMLDRLIASHADMNQQQHEYVGNVTLNTFHLMEYPAGERFLPWHRSFLMECENAMRAAVTQADGWQEGARVFIPYWDASHMTGMPTWAADYLPTGMIATAVAGLPPNHPGFGTPVGKPYKVQIQRFPGTTRSTSSLPAKELMATLLNVGDYQSFTRRLEWAPTIMRTATLTDLTRLRQLSASINDPQQNYALIPDILSTGNVPTSQHIPLMTAFTRLESISMDASYVPSASQQAANELLSTAFQFYLVGPHNNMHGWVGGRQNLVKGTIIYMHETVADPLFWMLHCEVDRMWATWQTRYTANPNLQGQDATFQPLQPGQIWKLGDLLNTRRLGYSYDQLYAA